MKHISVLNGPNLNLLGTREREIYGNLRLADLEDLCRRWGESAGFEVLCRQTNHEGELLDWLHAAAREERVGIVLNAGGLTHTSVALRDAISGIPTPVVEVHISNVHAREPFRHESLIAPVCAGTVTGFGILGYKLAIQALAERSEI